MPKRIQNQGADEAAQMYRAHQALNQKQFSPEVQNRGSTEQKPGRFERVLMGALKMFGGDAPVHPTRGEFWYMDPGHPISRYEPWR